MLGRPKFSKDRTQQHLVNGVRMSLVPIKRPSQRLHKVTTNMDLDEALSFSLNTREFNPIVLRRMAKCGVPFFYILREISAGENLELYHFDRKRDGLFYIEQQMECT